jgi:hypothetical protein
VNRKFKSIKTIWQDSLEWNQETAIDSEESDISHQIEKIKSVIMQLLGWK